MDLTHNKGDNLTQTGREEGIRRLMSINSFEKTGKLSEFFSTNFAAY